MFAPIKSDVVEVLAYKYLHPILVPVIWNLFCVEMRLEAEQQGIYLFIYEGLPRALHLSIFEQSWWSSVDQFQ